MRALEIAACRFVPDESLQCFSQFQTQCFGLANLPEVKIGGVTERESR